MFTIRFVNSFFPQPEGCDNPYLAVIGNSTVMQSLSPCIQSLFPRIRSLSPDMQSLLPDRQNVLSYRKYTKNNSNR